MKPFKQTKPPVTTPSAAGHLLEVLELFSGHASGPVQNITVVEGRLAAAWDDLSGDDGGMRGEKLIGRTESMSWHPPLLRFRIERHGATVMGSTKAEVQEWAIDLERGTKSLVTASRRQVRPTQPRADVASVASEIVAAVTGGPAQQPATQDARNVNKEGFICVVTNPAFPNVVMIEQAARCDEFLDRVQEWSPYRDYELHHASHVADRFQAKSNVCEQLAAARVRDGEWFGISVEDAVRVVADIAKKYQV